MAHLTIDSYNGFLAPLLPLLMAKHDFSVGVAASLASLLAFSTSFLQPLFGYLADRLRPRALVWAAPLVAGGFLSLIGVAPNYVSLAALLLFSGLGTAAFHPLGATLVHALSGERKGAGTSLFVTGGNVGHSIGPLIIMPVVAWLGLERSYVTVVPALVMTLLLYRSIPKPASVVVVRTSFDGLPGRGPRLTALLLLWVLVTLRATIIAGFSNFMPILLRERGNSLIIGGAAITAFQLVGALGGLVGGRLSDAIGRRPVFLLSFTLSFPFFLAFLRVQSATGLLLISAAGFLIYLSIPVNLLEAQDLFPTRVSTVSSLMIGLAWGVAGLLLTPLGALADSIGVDNTLNGLAVATLVGVPLTLALPQVRQAEDRSLALERTDSPRFAAERMETASK